MSSANETGVYGDGKTLVGGSVNGDRTIAYLKFTMDSLPVGTRLQKAELRLTREGRSWPPAVKVKSVLSSTWSEPYLSWKNRPPTGVDLATVRPRSNDPELRVDLSTVVRAAGTYTFAVSSPNPNNAARFRSKEYGSQGPTLFVTPASGNPVKPPVTTPKPPEDKPGGCAVDAKLVPTCGLLWGAAAGGFNKKPRDTEMKAWEKKSGRPATVFHTYHSGDQVFPTPSEIAMARDPNNPRLLLMNWRVADGSTWAKVAAGRENNRIDKLAARVKATFNEKFILVLHHEPENEVNPKSGSGMTAKDFAAMFRYTAKRLKAQGADNILFAMAYMNYEKWHGASWWHDLYPGDDVVDWLAVDTYVNAQPGGFHNGGFGYLMDRSNDETKFPGWYTWATTKHPGKPIILAEWGAYDSSPRKSPANKAKFFDTVLPQLSNFPAVKGLVYFDTERDQAGRDMRIDESAQSLAAFRKIAADPRFNVRVR